MTKLYIMLLMGVLAIMACPAAPALEMRGDTIYLMVPDRFFDGDSSNNTAVDPNLYSPTKSDWQKYWGGDLAGVKQKLDYLQSVGVTTIWVTPVYQNAPVIGTYHGYQMQDLFRVDPHFGTFATLDSLTCDMHSRGMKMMLDLSLNSGPATAAGNPSGSQCLLKQDGIIKARYSQDNLGWFHHYGPIDFNSFTYWDQVNKDIFGLADLNQDTSAVRDYLKQGGALWQYHGIDCFRLDAAKHFEPSFGREWMNSANQVAGWLGKPGTYAVAEWYGGGAWNSESLWWTSTAGTTQFDFQLEEQLRGVAGEWKSMYDLRNTLNSRQSAYGVDGSGSPNVHWQVNFFDSQDTQRLIVPLLQKYGYANAAEVQQRIAMSLGLLEMMPGIPMVFYGTEQYLYDDTVNDKGVAGGDPYNRPQMTTFNLSTAAAQVLKKASDLRRIHPAVQYGDIVERWIDSGLFVFSRQASGSAVLVGVNNGWQNRTVTVTAIPFPDGTYNDVLGLTNAISINGGTADVTVPARSTVVFSYLPNPLIPAAISDNRCSIAPPATGGPPPSGGIIIDGADIPADFSGYLRAVQNNPTGFGDANGISAGSEMDQLFVTNDGTNLYLGITGNLELNGNFWLVFLETGPAGTNTVTASTGPDVMPGLIGTRMDDGFSPRWVLAVNAAPSGVFYADLVDLVNNTKRFLGAGMMNSGTGVLTGGDILSGELIAFNNTNIAGVTGMAVAGANTASTGMEVKLPFSSLNLLTGVVKVFAIVTGHTAYFSNQGLPGMGASTSGSVGGYSNLGSGPVDFGKVVGTQYVSVSLQSITYMSCNSVQEARMQPDGQPVSVTGRIGTGSFPFINSFYIQDPVGVNGIQSYSGIRVVKSSSSVVQYGQEAAVKGFLGTVDGERAILATEVTPGGPAAVPGPVFVSNKELGGSPCAGSLGIWGAAGLGTTGSHVRIWGTVKVSGTDSQGNAFFYVDDGAGLTDGSIVNGAPAVGVRVYSSSVFPESGKFVIVRGVSGVEYINGKSQRRVLTRLPSDVTPGN